MQKRLEFDMKQLEIKIYDGDNFFEYTDSSTISPSDELTILKNEGINKTIKTLKV